MNGVDLLRRFLEENNWNVALDTATTLLESGELSHADRAYCYYAQCGSLQGLERFSAAIPPGYRAVAAATDAGDLDLAGRALLQLGYLQFMQKRYTDAADSWSEYLRNVPKYTNQDLKERSAEVMKNLGVAFRAMGEHTRALDTFLQAWELAKQNNDSTMAEATRSNAVWDALLLRQTDVARRLMGYGDSFIKNHPDDRYACAMHTLDLARCACVEGDLPTAAARAMEAAVQAEQFPDLTAGAFQILMEVALGQQEYEAATAFGLYALERAQVAERYDLVTDIQAAIERLLLRAPEAVLQVAGEMFMPQTGSTGKTRRRRARK